MAKIRRNAFVAALGMLVMLLIGCAGDPDQAALEASIASAQGAAEKGSMAEVMDLLADDFVGQKGAYDQKTLRRLFVALQLRHRDIGVSRVSTEYEVRGNFATVQIKMLVTGGSGGMLPDTGRVVDVTTRWRVDDGQWKIVGADWDGDFGI